MRPKERQESGEQDLFRARLDQIIDLDHTLDHRFHESCHYQGIHPSLQARIYAFGAREGWTRWRRGGGRLWTISTNTPSFTPGPFKLDRAA